MSFPLQSFLQSSSLNGEIFWAVEWPKDYLLLFFFAAFWAFCEPSLYVFERDTAIGLQLSPTKQLWPRHPCVCIDIGVYEIHLRETISSDQVIKMLIKIKVRQTKKTKKALASFTGTHNDTKGLALFLYWALKHGPEDSTVYQMLLNAYSMRPHNWP